MFAPHTRRRFLRSGSALVALPALESLGFHRFAGAASPATPPKRLVFLGFGWGVTEESWYPNIEKPGPAYTLPPGLQPLARHKADFSVVQGLSTRAGRRSRSPNSSESTNALYDAVGVPPRCGSRRNSASHTRKTDDA